MTLLWRAKLCNKSLYFPHLTHRLHFFFSMSIEPETQSSIWDSLSYDLKTAPEHLDLNFSSVPFKYENSTILMISLSLSLFNSIFGVKILRNNSSTPTRLSELWKKKNHIMKQNNSHFVPGRKWSLFLVSEVVLGIMGEMARIIEKNSCVYHKSQNAFFSIT